MRRQLAQAMMMATITGSLALAHAGQAIAQTIPDKNLEAVLRSLVFEKRDKTDPLTDDDLRKIYVLEAKGKGIRDLKGLEKCTNLQLLNLAKNEITDLIPIAGLANIQSLDLSNNKIADVAPIAKLTALQFLEISNNQIASVEPLAELSKVSALYAAGNKITDIKPIGKLTGLSSLDLANNQIVDIGPLATVMRLSLLKLNDNRVEDISSLAKQTQLRMLLIERNKISNLSALVARVKEDAEGEKRFAPFLRAYLSGNPLGDLEKNEQLVALKKYGVRIEQSESKAPPPAGKPAVPQGK